MERIEPDLGVLFRVAASHAIECALADAHEPNIVLDIAQHHFKKMFGKTADWPDRGVLN